MIVLPMRAIALLACLAVGLQAAPAVSAPAAPKPAVSAPARHQPETLDTTAIHSQYTEGEFDAVIQALEGYMRRNRAWSRDDSVFIAKHLAVVYSANPATREKGRYYMHQLLEILPTAKLVGMYVSEEIDRIFEKMREEYADRRGRSGIGLQPEAIRPLPDSGAGRDVRSAPVRDRTAPGEAGTAPVGDGKVSIGDRAAARMPAKAPEKKRGAKVGFWLAGGTGVLVAGLAGYYFMHEGPDAGPDKVYDVPSR